MSLRSDVFLIDYELVESGREQPYLSKPKFRRASRGMIMTYVAVESLLERSWQLKELISEQRLGVVVGTSQGELEITKNFLTTLVKSETARPILFQNSLHNAVLGFLSIEFGIKGASMTVSNGSYSGEDAVATALDFLRADWCDACIAIGWDTKVNSFEKVWAALDPENVKRGEGAGALLLVNQSGLNRLSARSPITRVVEVETGGKIAKSTGQYIDYYDSNGIASFSRLLEVTPHACEIQIGKPNGSSRFVLGPI